MWDGRTDSAGVGGGGAGGCWDGSRAALRIRYASKLLLLHRTGPGSSTTTTMARQRPRPGWAQAAWHWHVFTCMCLPGTLGVPCRYSHLLHARAHLQRKAGTPMCAGPRAGHAGGAGLGDPLDALWPVGELLNGDLAPPLGDLLRDPGSRASPVTTGRTGIGTHMTS